jgi:hypothetical protein
MSEFGFIVPSCPQNITHKKYFYDCINSIYKYHPGIDIVVIFSNASDQSVITEIKKEFPLLIYESSILNISADMLALFYYKLNNYFKKAIVIHDGMKVLSQFNVTDVNDINYIWYATIHQLMWDKIKEPESDFNKKNNIIVHDDLNKYIINHLIINDEFKKYCQSIYMSKEKWSVCFGPCYIITYDFLIKLDNDTNIIDLMMKMHDKRMRITIESILPLACQYSAKREIHSGYDGLYMDSKGYHNRFSGQFISKQLLNRL